MYETSKAAQVANEMCRYDIVVLEICESRWNGAGRITPATRELLVYSGHDDGGSGFYDEQVSSKSLDQMGPCVA